MISSEKKSKIIADLQTDKKDTGSEAVQVGILTERINELTAHLKANKHDYMARRGLLQMVGQRKRLLKYIAEKDSKAYLALIKKLGIRRARSA
jgi:small subunit ribosomal protein S15